MNTLQLIGLEEPQLMAQINAAQARGLHEIQVGQVLIRFPPIVQVSVDPYDRK